MNENLIKKLQGVELIANYSKVRRMLNNPLKYIKAIFHKEYIYPKTKMEKVVDTYLFFGKKMKVALPASTDIYLTGGKSHSSEIRLALFLIKNLKTNDKFLDIGAHYGYFTLLASEIVGLNGQVISFEPTSKSFQLLKLNTEPAKNIKCFQKAISNSEDNIVFYEFPNLHSEYNSTDITQFEKESWYKITPPTKVEVKCTTIDKITHTESFNPKIIKIDVEGAEYKVINGGLSYFQTHSPFIVMEYLEPKRKNETHVDALNALLNIGYKSHIIDKDGNLEPINNVDNYLINNNLESDNVVFIK